MQNVLDRLAVKISNAELDFKPSENFYIEDVFPWQVYAEILARLPADEQYDFIEHPDAIRSDGSVTRKLLDLTSDTIRRLDKSDQRFWSSFIDALTSDTMQKLILNKFKNEINKRFGLNWPDMVTVPILYRDFPGYKISEHTDAPYKIATMQFYFPRDRSQLQLGTSFHEKNNSQFRLLKTNTFKPNSAYAFARTDNSWHSVRELPDNVTRRDSLALTIYEKNKEYKSGKKY